MKLIISTLTFFAFASTTFEQTITSYLPTDNIVGNGNKELKNNKNLNVISDIYE